MHRLKDPHQAVAGYTLLEEAHGLRGHRIGLPVECGVLLHPLRALFEIAERRLTRGQNGERNGGATRPRGGRPSPLL